MNKKVLFIISGVVVALVIGIFVVFQGEEYNGIKYKLEDKKTLVKSKELYLSLYHDNKRVIDFLVEEDILPRTNVEVRLSAPSDKVTVRVYRGEVNKELTYRVSNYQLGRDNGLKEAVESFYQVVDGKVQEVPLDKVSLHGFDGDIDGAFDNILFDIKPIPAKINVEISQEVEKRDGLLKVNIKTNLPDKSELIIGLSQKDGSYSGQSKAVVMDGKASSAWFSNRGAALSRGEYKLTVSMSIAPTQSEEVRKVIGLTGEKLQGNLVKRENDMSSVHYETIIELKDGANIDQSQMNKKHKEMIKGLYNELITEYNRNLKSYNPMEFGNFRADWNRRRNAAQSQLDSEGASQENSLAIRELIPLETELKNKLAGKRVDDEFIKQTRTSIESIIR